MDFLVDSASPDSPATAHDLHLVTHDGLPEWLAAQDKATETWLKTQAFKADRHQIALLPPVAGRSLQAVVGLGALASPDAIELWHAAGLPEKLPAGTAWRVSNELSPGAAAAFALGWAYGSYRFDAYRSARPTAVRARLIAASGVEVARINREAAATALARDLVNTPASDMTPERLAAAAIRVAREHGAVPQEILGDELRRGFPAIHAVGQASASAPRLVDFAWGDPAHPRVTIVGKGVCFDTGGLDIKPAAGMALMKKDMGGAACVLGLAQLVMASRLPVRLRVLIPAVENAIAGNAYRPGDVIRTRKGITVEIGNTDAEGRLVLCDALALADDEKPDLLVDLATLTGAARVALGPELPALFGTRQQTVEDLLRHGRQQADPLWQLPLWNGYDDDYSSKVADINNSSATAFAGSIIGALYLRRFVTQSPDWLHVDLFAWNPKERPGRPVGAEAHAVRALFAYLAERYA
ncbi:MAG: leucyl aminopeptidase family protein [Gammaproteobacteria bacterium]|nr:leucyl aminopeptidase family protein [Gammaproteobacteria bacterium]